MNLFAQSCAININKNMFYHGFFDEGTPVL